MTRLTLEGGEGEYESWRDLALAYPLAHLSLAELSDDEAKSILAEMEEVLPHRLARTTGGAGRKDALPSRDSPVEWFAAINAPRLRDLVDPMAAYAKAALSDSLGYPVDDVCAVFISGDVDSIRRIPCQSLGQDEVSKRVRELMTFSDTGEVTLYEAAKGGGLAWSYLAKEQCAAEYLVAIEDVLLAKAQGDIEAAIEAADRRGLFRARLEHIEAHAAHTSKQRTSPTALVDFVKERFFALHGTPPNKAIHPGKKKRTVRHTSLEIFREIEGHPELSKLVKGEEQIRHIIKKLKAEMGE